MKEIIVKEFFWLIIGSLISLILSFVFLGLLELTSAAEEMNGIEKVSKDFNCSPVQSANPLD